MCDVLKTQADDDLLLAPKHASSLAQISFNVPALLAIYNVPSYARRRNLQSHSCENVKCDQTSPLLNHIVALHLHQVVSLTTGPQLLPKRFLHSVRSRASCPQFQYLFPFLTVIQ